MIVLAFLVLITVMAVAFFTSTTGEAGASKVESESLSVRQLADSSVQYILSHIRNATSGGTTTAWASQPGAIRTYGSDGNPQSVFKLYSATTMEESVPASGWNPSSDQPGATWSADKALWTDLNAPVASGNRTVFPIIDPRAAAAPSGKSHPMVDGFSYNATAMPGAVLPTSTDDANARVPMPVRWLYVLKDGRFTAPSGGNGTTANFSGSNPKPTATNPIVGRVAFWTDDETCKLNLNTACGGNYWDVPMLGSVQDLFFARHQPSKNEFNRYPGHPATTSLVPVLWSLGDSPLLSPFESLMPVLSNAPASPPEPLFPSAASVPYRTIPSVAILPVFSSRVENFLDGLFELSPRNSWKNAQGSLAGSTMGLKPTVIDTTTKLSLNPLSSVDGDRLYSSVDEAFFLAPTSSQTTRSRWSNNLKDIDLDKIRFFLTTHSRAPETNLFNQPKITIWPIDDHTRSNPVNQFYSGADGRSPVDRLIAFCSTLNGFPYYFTRNDPSSATADWTPRNAQVYDYLVRLMEEPIPGFGASFASRFSDAGCERLATLTYDYIRSAVNLADTTSTPSGFSGLTNDSFKYYFSKPPIEKTPPGRYDPQPGTGQVVPIEIGNTKGIGRFPVIQQATLHFIAQAANQPPVLLDSNGRPTTTINPMHPWVSGPPTSAYLTTTNGTTTISYENGKAYPSIGNQTHAGLPFLTNQTGSDGILQVPNARFQINPLPAASVNSTGSFTPHKTQIQAAFYLTLVNVAAGNTLLNSDLRIRVRGLGNFRADGQQIFSPSLDSVIDVFNSPPSYFQVGQNILNRSTNSTATTTTTPLKANYIGIPVIVGQGTYGETFSFTGGTLSIDLLTPSNEIVQTVNLEFPNSTFPTPLLPPLANSTGRFGSQTRNLLFSSSVLSDNATSTVNYPPTQIKDLTPSTMLTFDINSALATNPSFGVGNSSLYRNNCTRIDQPPSNSSTDYNNRSNSYPWENLYVSERGGSSTSYPNNLTADTIRSVEVLYGDPRIVALNKTVPSRFFKPNRFYHDSKLRPAHSLRVRGHFPLYLTASALELQSTWNSSIPLVYKGSVTGSSATPSATWDIATADEIARLPSYVSLNHPFTTSSSEFDNGKFHWSSVSNFSTVWSNGGDFGTSLPRHPDAPHIGKAEEGTMKIEASHPFPYFHIQSEVASSDYPGETLFSPNRQVPSAVVFGSLPIGNTPEEAWRTWLFCPNPVSTGHVSFGKNPPDYAYLDFFHMPVVEPYAISDPFSTAGKVNLNYQIAPFNYINRSTALRGVLQSEMVTAIPDRHLGNKNLGSNNNKIYEVPALGGGGWFNSQAVGYSSFRYPVHSGETLKQFDSIFNSGRIFRSASEICSIWLYPAQRPGAIDASKNPEVSWNADNSSIKSWWYDNPGGTCKSVTGDNLRERPYSTLYPRLTTKSNTYTVHHRVQTLQKAPGGSPNVWDESKDKVGAEYRGSALVERYIDPSDPNIPDFTLPANAGKSMDGFYRFRILQTKRFAP